MNHSRSATRLIYGSILPVLLLAGCCNTKRPLPQHDPVVVPLEEAIISVMNDLYAAQDAMEATREASGRDPIGFMPSTASFTFKVTASESGSKKVFVNLTPIAALGGGAEAVSGSSRGQENTITVTFSNLYLSNPATTAFFAADAERWELIRDRIMNGTTGPVIMTLPFNSATMELMQEQLKDMNEQ